MKKWIGLLKSIIISFLVYMWFLGSSILIKIDSNQLKDARETALSRQRFVTQNAWGNEMLNLTESINSYCKLKINSFPKKIDMKILNQKVSEDNVGSTEKLNEVDKTARETLMQARRMKTIRDSVIYVPQLQQFWCLVPKAASTSWSHKIIDSIPSMSSKMQTDLRNTSIPIQVVLRKHFGSIGTKKYKEILSSKSIQKIVLARHPLSRLVSAFEDKLKDRKARLDSMYFYGHYGVKIKKEFRKNRHSNKRKEPTFEEFVDYLIKTDPEDYDEHWKPISLLCGLCHINYNHVIKQEDLKNDLEFHLRKLGYIAMKTSSKALQRENKSFKEFETVKAYFENITNEKKLQLFRKYEDDFQLFRYNKDVI